VKGTRKLIVLATLAFVSVMGAFAQGSASSKSVSIRLVAVVPAILRLSLDFAQDSTAQISGFVANSDAADNATPANAPYSVARGSRFEIKSGSTVDLGNARLYSNVMSSYSVNVYSANGGTLRDPTDAAKGAISYQLCLGDSVATARGGAFTFATSGKSSMTSAPLRVALAIDNVPQTASGGFYSDQLMFSVSAN
jgi:hypothetical protein